MVFFIWLLYFAHVEHIQDVGAHDIPMSCRCQVVSESTDHDRAILGLLSRVS